MLLVIQRSKEGDTDSLLRTVYLCINRVRLLPYVDILALPADLQRSWIVAANEDLEKRDSELRIREESVDSGHSPFLSRTEQTADFIRRVAGEDVPIS